MYIYIYTYIYIYIYIDIHTYIYIYRCALIGVAAAAPAAVVLVVLVVGVVLAVAVVFHYSICQAQPFGNSAIRTVRAMVGSRYGLWQQLPLKFSLANTAKLQKPKAPKRLKAFPEGYLSCS